MLRRTRPIVKERAGFTCEWPGCKVRGSNLDLSHNFFRGHRIGQPLCDHPAAVAYLCRPHHDACHGLGAHAGETDTIDRLEWSMAMRCLREFNLYALARDEIACFDGATALEVMRWLERRLKETGVIVHGRWAE